jgi:mannose-6-phosphate isomerase-like protein (cupin superfamily)
MSEPSQTNDVPLKRRKEKPWGYERPLAEFRGVFLKELFFRKGMVGSLHYHKQKDEFFYVVKGKVRVTLNDQEFVLTAGDTLHVIPGQQHRIYPIKDTLILELGTRMFGDVIRIADEYDRPQKE